MHCHFQSSLKVRFNIVFTRYHMVSVYGRTRLIGRGVRMRKKSGLPACVNQDRCGLEVSSVTTR